MRRGVANLLLAGLVVLGGCAGIRAASVGADLCSPLPEPDQMSVLDAARRHRRGALAAALGAHLAKQGAGAPGAALQGLAPCLTVEPVPGAGGAVAVVNLALRYYVSGGVLVYGDGNAWRTWPLDQGEHLDWVTPVLAVRSSGGLELIARTVNGGSGGFGRLQLYRLGEQVRRLWESPEFEHFSHHILSPEYVLTFHRPEGAWQEPHASTANCCMPVDGEVLWRRQGERFVKQAERIHPNPHRAVSLFVGALRKGDRATAQKWAASPEVVAEGAKVANQLQPDNWHREDEIEQQLELDKAERLYWDAIPAHLRGPRPKVSELSWQAGPYNLYVRRLGGQWKVVGIKPAADR